MSDNVVELVTPLSGAPSIAQQLRRLADELEAGVNREGMDMTELDRCVAVMKQRGTTTLHLEVCEGWDIDRFTLCGLMHAAADMAINAEGGSAL
jgi:hypothetical protein